MKYDEDLVVSGLGFVKIVDKGTINIYIDKENSGNSKVTLSKAPKYGLENGQRFYAMNMLEELDIDIKLFQHLLDFIFIFCNCL